MIMTFLNKKFWIVVLALAALYYFRGRTEDKARQVVQTENLMRHLVHHDLDYKIGILNSLLDGIKKERARNASIINECDALKTTLYKIRSESKQKAGSALADSFQALADPQGRILELSRKSTNPQIQGQRALLETMDRKAIRNKIEYQKSNEKLDKYKNSPILKGFVKQTPTKL